MEPRNTYIQAIIDRVHVLQKDSAPGSERSLGSTSHHEVRRYLSVTVGAEFTEGIKQPEDLEAIPPKDTQARVRHLTDVAEKFLERGSYENAFDSLFKAYLLDPVSPYVIACEKTVLPAWELAHRQDLVFDSPKSFTDRGPMTGASSPQALGGDNVAPGGTERPEAEEQRLELLKQQREAERQQRERALWREASNPPKIFGEEDVHDLTEFPSLKTEPRKPEKGFFLKLKRGKFLGH
jgi:hypothetical protein